MVSEYSKDEIIDIIKSLREMDVPGECAYILEGCAADALEQLQKERDELKVLLAKAVSEIREYESINPDY